MPSCEFNDFLNLFVYFDSPARTVGQDHHFFSPHFAKHAIVFPVLIGIQINF